GMDGITSEGFRCDCGEWVPAPPPGEPLVRCACGRAFRSEALAAVPGWCPSERDAVEPAEEDGGAFDVERALRGIRRPEVHLCSPAAVGVGTFLCGPVAGFLLMAHNDGQLKRRARGWLMLLAGLVYPLALALLSDSLFDSEGPAGWFIPAVVDLVLLA